MTKIVKLSMVLGLMLTWVAAGQAAPVQWSTNGHWYEAVETPAGISWTAASAAATARGGYLATATSAEENTFIFGLIDTPAFWFMDSADNNEGPWLGGYFDGPDGTMNTTEWKWVSGEAWSFASWDGGEPNFASERYANYFSNDASSGNPIREALWNNVPDEGGLKGYIVEWNANPVPVPGAVWLLGSGLAGLAALRRWQR